MIRIVAALSLFTLLAGCGGDPSAAPPSEVPSSTKATTSRPSAEPTRSTEEDPSRSETGERQSSDEPAVLGYRKFVTARDVMTASGGKQTKHLPKVATGVLLRGALDQAKAYRGMKLRTTTRTRILWARTVGTHSKSEVTVQACYDPALPVDASGRSAVKPGAPTRWQDEMRMRLDGSTWKASFAKTRATAC